MESVSWVLSGQCEARKLFVYDGGHTERLRI